MPDSNIPKDLANTFKGIFTNFNTDRLSELLVALILCVVGFFLARLISNAFIRTIGARFNAHQRLVWRRGIFYFIFIGSWGELFVFFLFFCYFLDVFIHIFCCNPL